MTNKHPTTPHPYAHRLRNQPNLQPRIPPHHQTRLLTIIPRATHLGNLLHRRPQIRQRHRRPLTQVIILQAYREIPSGPADARGFGGGELQAGGGERGVEGVAGEGLGEGGELVLLEGVGGEGFDVREGEALRGEGVGGCWEGESGGG